MATAPPSGTVLDSAAPAVLVTAASFTFRPGRVTTMGGQLVARLMTPRTTDATTIRPVMRAMAEVQSPVWRWVSRYQTAKMTTP